MNYDKITQLEQLITAEYANIAGIVVLKGAEIRYEQYFNGLNHHNKIHIASVTKSILSLLLGIAIDEGAIQSINQPVLDFFPNYRVKRGEKTLPQITLKDMLTMTAPYKYKSTPYTKHFSSEDWVTSALDLLGGKGQIGNFRYTPIVGPDIFSGILTQATGQSVLSFARERLFHPLGIEVAEPITLENKEKHLAFLKDTTASGWVTDPMGVQAAGWGLTLSPMDMAKIGRLCLNSGVWQGTQLVPAEWIAESTRTHSTWGKLPYGYLWWVINQKEHSYAALGDGGNVIYVNGKKNLVVAIASLFQPRAKERMGLIRQQIEPLFE